MSSGFTLLESVVSLVLFSVVGYALMIAADVSGDSRRAVMGAADEDRALRLATSTLIDELGSSSDATITISTLADGNHQVRFQLPIQDGTTAAWGVYQRGTPQSGWYVQYTVTSVVGSSGAVERTLVRQVLDDQLSVRDTDQLIGGLRDGAGDPPGFKMVHSGEIWELTLSTLGRTDGNQGIKEVFHVRTRN